MPRPPKIPVYCSPDMLRMLRDIADGNKFGTASVASTRDR
jgi:hypothetical protein